MPIPITAVSASILGIWLVILSIRVILRRGSARVDLGDGGDEILLRRMRAQGNLSEYGPTGLLLLLIAELQGTPYLLLLAMAAVLVLGRLIHGIAFSFTQRWMFGRVGGMVLTFTGIGLLALTVLWQALMVAS